MSNIVGFRWLSGMRDSKYGGRIIEASEVYIELVCDDNTQYRWLRRSKDELWKRQRYHTNYGFETIDEEQFAGEPDFSDPATRGCLLQLVREAYGEVFGKFPGTPIWCEYIAKMWHVCIDGTLIGGGCSTEVEALLEALADSTNEREQIKNAPS